MRPVLFSILFSILSISSFSQNYDAKSSSLANTGITQTGVWSNFTNQAGLAEVKKFTVGLAIKNSFLSKPHRVWVHTCSLDHKNALINYTSRGMKIFKKETITVSTNFEQAV